MGAVAAITKLMTNPFNINRDPAADPRTRRALDQLQCVLNSLLDSGVIVLAGPSRFKLGDITTRGAPGFDGEPGEDGRSIKGDQGERGLTGFGFPGFDGQDGEDAFPMPGPQGLQGLTGLGFPGFDGEPGEDGISIKGDKGDTGATGATGAGTQGVMGIPGFDGEPGEEPLWLMPPAAAPTPVRGDIDGLTISNNTTDPIYSIDLAAGVVVDSTTAILMQLSAAITQKALNVAWAVGSSAGLLDTGSIATATSTTYHIYLIRRPDTAVVDVIASTSASAPTLPTNYTQYRRIGSILWFGAVLTSISNASPGVVTWTALNNHGFAANDPVVFYAGTGVLPSQLVAGTTYFVKTLTNATQFTVSATAGGTAINTTGGSGTPVCARVRQFNQRGNQFLLKNMVGNFSNSSVGTTATSKAITTPAGIKTDALLSVGVLSGTVICLANFYSPDQADEAVDSSHSIVQSVAAGGLGLVQAIVRTDTSNQIRANTNAANGTVYISTIGWIDTRGRDL